MKITHSHETLEILEVGVGWGRGNALGDRNHRIRAYSDTCLSLLTIYPVVTGWVVSDSSSEPTDACWGQGKDEVKLSNTDVPPLPRVHTIHVLSKRSSTLAPLQAGAGTRNPGQSGVVWQPPSLRTGWSQTM